ncbi:putative protein modifier of SNC1 1 [Helianthus annuus]|nr:putative protein modifier of SNC1 1 [Helianthus annuus]
MTSSMLAGERRWASSRRGGMTVLGKVAVPKPINLPSQKLENHGLDPNVEIVPKGSLSWGSRSSSSASNPWGSSSASPNTDGSSTVSPHHPSGRPSSGGGLSRPSTAGSDRHEPSATWGPNSRPSSASGVLASNQSSLTSSRPLSAETRPGSSHLSRFAEPVYDNSVAWGPNGTAADKLSISSKVNDFSLSSGDFPTLGSEKDNTSKSSEPHDHVRPGSSSGRGVPAKERNETAQAGHKSGTIDTWTRDVSPNFEDGVVHSNADKWQGDPPQYFNSNVPPQHYDAWRGPPMNTPPGVWYRGPPPAGPPYPPVPHGGFPMEPFPYYHRPQKSKASNESWGNKSSNIEDPKDLNLIHDVEGLNPKVRALDIQGDAEQNSDLSTNPTIAFGSISITGDLSHHYDKSRQVHHHNRGRSSNQDTDGWRKKPPILGLEISTPENPEIKNTESTQMVDLADGQAQRAKMRELAKQRAIERQKEEEERIREQKAKALAKLEELNRRTLAAADGTAHTAEKNATRVPEQVDVDGSQKPTGLTIDDGIKEPVDQISVNSQQEPADQSLLVKQGVANATDAESKAASLGNDGGVHRQKRAIHKQKPSVQTVEALVDKSTLSGTADTVIKNPVLGEAVSSQESTLPNNSNIVSESTQPKKRTNKSSKNKHKVDDASASREVNLSKPESQTDLNQHPSAVSMTDSKDTKQSNLEQVSSLPSNQYKPQHPRRMPRNPQANRFHVGDVAVWAPVRAQNKEESVQDDVPLPDKSVTHGQTNLKSKRAEMERYVPKPVAKELDQQGNVNKSPSSPKKSMLEDVTGSVGPTVEAKSGDNKQTKQVKSHAAGRQQDVKKSHHKSTSQHEESLSNPVRTETNVTHEWDPSDGWFMPDEYPTTGVTSVTTAVKDEGGVTGKEKRPAYKGQRSVVKNHKDVSSAEMEVDQTDRPASSKENHSHWHPKPQQYKGGWSGGGQTSHSEVKKESRRYSSNAPNMEDEAQVRQFEQPHHVSTGFRKYGGQNNRSGGQDDKPKHNPHNANTNRERQRQNLHYEYQPVGSNNNNSNDGGSGNAGSQYKERSSGSGQSRRGGGSYYGRQ